ncbi:glycoside hydrolase family 5 protein [Clostridium manihotivorum]|uniref:Endoglucanase n=1 Tax=Clostridium manihotivorum TaxID=2320868 RepID=A0A3R5U875_9CLOT|nr:glycoside hydrolase family 5 protein [Clostridium manihotivorum]QAA34456.1 endoglucanase [Clostridium manihotivorum]
MGKRLNSIIKTICLSVIVSTTALATNINAKACSTTSCMRSINSLQVVKEMKLGWNLGNTLDASPTETSWGNPVTTKAMIDKIKAAGFNTVRIPITWKDHIGGVPDYKIDKNWLDRVEQVADYALDNNMYAIINLHHEDTWLVPTYAKEKEVTSEITKLWKQIADRFKKYGDHLIFETMNEPRLVGSDSEWTGGTAEGRDVVNRYNTAAVNTIRNTGGNNKYRFIMIPTYAAAALPVTYDSLVIPNNDKRVIVSLHMYSPYSFAMDINGTSYWGSDSDKAQLDTQFDAIYNKFVKNGIAVVIGEFGSINKNNQQSRAALAEYYVRDARNRGITTIWWDNGISTAGQADTYGIFDRQNLTWSCPEVKDALIRGASN